MKALLLAALCAPALAPAQDLPHIVVILADDMGMGDLGAYNENSKIPTPTMDRIAREGTRFTDVHSPSAVCTPTRYGLLTGRYAWRSRLKRGVLNGWSHALIEKGRPTIARALQQKGYVTGGFGKWHLGLQAEGRVDYSKPLTPGPTTVGFDRYFGIPASLDMAPYVWVDDTTVESQPTGQTPGSKHRRQNGGGFWRKGPAAEDFVFDLVLDRSVDMAADWLDKMRREQPDAPVFLYVPLSAPHTPWLPSKHFRGKSGAGYYGDFVAQVDAAIGRLDKKLTELGIKDNTLLIITSDNGSHWPRSDIAKYGHAANLNFRGQKADIHEGGHRVPFLVRWPGRTPENTACHELGCLTDVFATIAQIVKVDLPEDAAEDSFSLFPYFIGGQTLVPVRDHVVHHSASGMFALREGPWKLIEDLGSGGFTAPRRIPKDKRKKGMPEGQLFNLARDPEETTNLWDEEPEIVAKLKARLTEIRKGERTR
eukprot:jgi/Undpi1/11719/HiC_scaffold_37.g14014.m1